MAATTATLVTAPRARACLGAKGPDAESYLNKMLSNDLAAVPVQGSCDALLLTAKARVIAPVRLVRRAVDDFLLLTEPQLGAVLARQLLRTRFAARVEIAEEEHTVTLVLGEGWAPPVGSVAAACADYGLPGWELIDAAAPEGARVAGADELERLRIVARTPRFGAEIDDRVMPAEAGLVELNVSFAKGCYPGQEPIARLHYRGHANRGLRVLGLGDLPDAEAEIVYEGKSVGRITSAAVAGKGAVALAYVRREVPDDAELAVGNAAATQLH